MDRLAQANCDANPKLYEPMRISQSLLLLSTALLVWVGPQPSMAQEWNMEKPFEIKDGVVDWYTYSGFRRYHAECHVCHGPNGAGSSFAPALMESVKTLSYPEFLAIVVAGRENVNTVDQNKMPAFGSNPNVMCYVQDIYSYLKARGEGGLVPGRPGKKQPKPDIARTNEDACMNNPQWKS